MEKANGEQNELALENQQLKDRVRDLKKSLEHFQTTELRLYYEFIQALANTFTAETLCSVQEVSRTAYYRYQRFKRASVGGKKQ